MNVNIPINSPSIIALIVIAIIIALAIRVFVSFWAKPKTPVSQLSPDASIKAGSKVSLTIDGMQCGMCEIHVKDSIRKAVPDVKKLRASHTKGKANFVMPETMTRGQLEKKLHETIDPNGYRIMGVEAK